MESEKTTSLRGVEQTMLLPLWGRYTESIKENGLIHDGKCIEIVDKMKIDFSDIEKQQHPGSRLSWIARAWNIDYELSRLQATEGPTTVVCLGCGLDTAYFRLRSKEEVFWYDIDLPRVIEVRKALIGESSQCTMIAGSVLSASTYQAVQVRGRLLVLAAGLLYYFTEAEVRQVLDLVAGLAASSTIIMDYCSRQGVEMANKVVLQNRADARMVWWANDATDLRALSGKIERVETYPLFQKILPRMTGQEAEMGATSDRFQIMSFAIMEMGTPPLAGRTEAKA